MAVTLWTLQGRYLYIYILFIIMMIIGTELWTFHEIVLPLFTVSKSNWKLERLFLRREGRQKTWGKPPWARTRTHNKLNSNVMPSLGIEPGPQWWQPLALCEKEQWGAIVQNDSFRNSLQWRSYIINSFDKPIHLFFRKHLFHCAKT